MWGCLWIIVQLPNHCSLWIPDWAIAGILLYIDLRIQSRRLFCSAQTRHFYTMSTTLSWRPQGSGKITALQWLFLNLRGGLSLLFVAYCPTICCEHCMTKGCAKGGVYANKSLSVLSQRIHTGAHTHTREQVPFCRHGPKWRCILPLLNAVLCRLKFHWFCSTEAVCVCLSAPRRLSFSFK